MTYQCDFGRAVGIGHHVRLYLHVSVVLTAPSVHPEIILEETGNRNQKASDVCEAFVTSQHTEGFRPLDRKWPHHDKRYQDMSAK